jgi:hypothetical protein
MTWNRAQAAAAIAGVLETVDQTVAVFAAPPETFNGPAFVVGYPRTVAYDSPTFAIDLAELPTLAAVGLGEIDRADLLLEQAKKAINADPTLGGAVQHARVTSQENWRRLTVGGADLLAADLIVTVRM